MKTQSPAKAMIQHCPRWMKTPPRSITAPLPALQKDHTPESLRIAQFEQSAATRNGVVPPFAPPSDTGTQYARDAAPGLDYDDELRDGFAFRYGAI